MHCQFHQSDRADQRRVPWMVVGLLILAAGLLQAQEIKLTASVSQNPVAVNQQFVYQLEVTGKSQSLPNVEMPPLEDFRLLRGLSTSSNYQYINGAISASKTFTVSLLPRKKGNFTIAPVEIRYKGKTYRSNEVRVTVTDAAASNERGGDAAGAKGDQPFLRAIASKKSVYVNEMINISYNLYFRNPLRNLETLNFPEKVGFWVEEYQMPQNYPTHTQTLRGVEYRVAEINKLALFPTKSGELTVSPMQISVDEVIRKRRRDPFRLFDDFFDDPFGRPVTRTLNSDELRIVVKPLPAAGRPVAFNGLVGSFRLDAEIDKNETRANEAISLKIKLNGSGNLKSLGELPIQFPPVFEVFDPKVKSNINRSGSQLVSYRELEYVLIPRGAGEFRIPPIEIPYFDPSSESYKTLKSEPFVITVTPGDELAGNGSGNFLNRSEVELLNRDIHFIKEAQLSLVAMNDRPYASPWFLTVLLLPALLLAIAWGYRGHQDKMSSNVHYARSRKALRQARSRLKESRSLLEDGNLSDFYSAVSRGLLGFVADKTNNAAAGLMRDEVQQILEAQQVDPSLRTDYLLLLDEADFRRFAPGQAGDGAAEEFYQQAETILVQLGKQFD